MYLIREHECSYGGVVDNTDPERQRSMGPSLVPRKISSQETMLHQRRCHPFTLGPNLKQHLEQPTYALSDSPLPADTGRKCVICSVFWVNTY
jgi:hypothetical protein